jgi:hypothetical protein
MAMRGCRAGEPVGSTSARLAKEQAERAHGDECTRPAKPAVAWPVVVVAMVDAVLLLGMGTGLALGAVGWLGWRGRLRRNRYLGVRTAAAMASDEAFGLANRAAAVPLLAASAVAVLGGSAALAARSPASAAVIAGVTLAGTAGLAVTGGVLGSLAAASLPGVRGAGGGCGGAAGGRPAAGDLTTPGPTCVGCACGRGGRP